MNAIVKTDGLPEDILQQVLAEGNLSRLTTQQKLAYYLAVCESLGLNPRTRPFRFLKLNGQELLYATRDCTDQLRGIRNVSVSIVEKKIEDGLCIVTARARMPDGREDEDMGAVNIDNLKGEARANAIMKAMTKAKRRVTLSLCGLGYPDESEVETIPGTFTEAAPSLPSPKSTSAIINDAIPTFEDLAAPITGCADWKEWGERLRVQLEGATTAQDVETIAGRVDVKGALAQFKNGALTKLNAMIKAALDRTQPAADDDGGDFPGIVTEDGA